MSFGRKFLKINKNFENFSFGNFFQTIGNTRRSAYPGAPKYLRGDVQFPNTLADSRFSKTPCARIARVELPLRLPSCSLTEAERGPLSSTVPLIGGRFIVAQFCKMFACRYLRKKNQKRKDSRSFDSPITFYFRICGRTSTFDIISL